MLISYCPHCQTLVPFVEEFLGREVFCAACGGHFVFEGPGIQPPPNSDLANLKPLVVKLAKSSKMAESAPNQGGSPPTNDDVPDASDGK